MFPLQHQSGLMEGSSCSAAVVADRKSRDRFGSVTGSSVNMAAVGVASRQLLPVLFVVALFTYVFFKNVLNSSALGLPIAPKYLSRC